MNKTERQKQLLNLIVREQIATQTELVSRLNDFGAETTQSSVSRDLDELKIIKIGGFYAVAENRQTYFAGISSLVKAGENLLVAKCESGLASAVAVRIDNAEIIEIVGTIAGDDTVFIAVRDAKNQSAAVRKIWELFE